MKNRGNNDAPSPAVPSGRGSVGRMSSFSGELSGRVRHAAFREKSAEFRTRSAEIML